MVNIGIIGVGYWGPNIARNINKIDEAQLYACCDLDEKKLLKIKKQYPLIQTTTNYNNLLTDSEIDAVIISTPADTHFTIAKKTINAHKNLLVEKPLSLKKTQANELTKLAKKNRLILMTGHTYEYNPAIWELKSLINKDSFGRIYHLYSVRLNLGRVRSDVNAMWNLAPHDFSIFDYLLDSKPIRVSAYGFSHIQKNIEDVAFINLVFPNNIMAHTQVSWLDPSKSRSITIVGEKRMAIFDDLDNETPLKIYDKGVAFGKLASDITIQSRIKLRSGKITSPNINNDEPLYLECLKFIDSIIRKKQSQYSLYSGVNIVSILEACQISLKNNSRWTKVHYD